VKRTGNKKRREKKKKGIELSIRQRGRNIAKTSGVKREKGRLPGGERTPMLNQ